uniref:Uncharacterized protein n=1 Tax=Gossypium raimondii TaxID=29730 RepID=A0A0D2PU86_GOSRA|nr:hypothetical protein B456_001G037300 [Gossypium raimondii]
MAIKSDLVVKIHIFSGGNAFISSSLLSQTSKEGRKEENLVFSSICRFQLFERDKGKARVVDRLRPRFVLTCFVSNHIKIIKYFSLWIY